MVNYALSELSKRKKILSYVENSHFVFHRLIFANTQVTLGKFEIISEFM